MVALLFLVAAGIVHFLPYEAQQEVAGLLRASVLRPFVLTQEGLTEARMRARQAGELRSQVDSMAAALSARTTLEEENRRLRGLLSLSARIGPSYRPATVLRSGTSGAESTFILDVGEDEGVRRDAPVITRHGLVGVVRSVGPRTSVGLDWTHPDFRASGMTLDGTAFGVVESRRGDFREGDRLVLNGTAFHSTLDQGTVVVTSGLGGIYPRGVPVGRVQALAEADAGWRKSYWLEAFAHPGSVTHVLVAVEDENGRDAAIGFDLSGAWPADSIMSDEELRVVDERREDSLARLGDSLRVLRSVVESLTVQDSLRRTILEETEEPQIPAPPVGGNGGGGDGGSGAGAVPPMDDRPGADV